MSVSGNNVATGMLSVVTSVFSVSGNNVIVDDKNDGKGKFEALNDKSVNDKSFNDSIVVGVATDTVSVSSLLTLYESELE